MTTPLQTIKDMWQPLTERQLQDDDAREIAFNVCGFFRVLADWADQDALERANDGQTTAADASQGGLFERRNRT